MCELTFEQRHETTPARDGTLAIMLAERKLHVEQGYATNNQHNRVRYQESPFARERDEFETFYVFRTKSCTLLLSRGEFERW